MCYTCGSLSYPMKQGVAQTAPSEDNGWIEALCKKCHKTMLANEAHDKFGHIASKQV